MKRCVLAVCLSFLSLSVSAQEPVTPGPEHAELKKLEGTWDATMKMVDGSEVKGVTEYKMTCGGLWLQSDFQADFGGQKFHGRGMDSYDPGSKKWNSVWVDSMSGGPMVLSGTREGKKTVMTGEGPGPGGNAKYRTVTTEDSADKMTFQMFMVSGNEETELMTVVYVRRK